MKQIRVFGPQNFRVATTEVPLLAPDEVLIDLQACGIWLSCDRLPTSLTKLSFLTVSYARPYLGQLLFKIRFYLNVLCLQTLYILFRRKTKHAGILTAKLRRTFIAYSKCHIGGIC